MISDEQRKKVASRQGYNFSNSKNIYYTVNFDLVCLLKWNLLFITCWYYFFAKLISETGLFLYFMA